MRACYELHTLRARSHVLSTSHANPPPFLSFPLCTASFSPSPLHNPCLPLWTTPPPPLRAVPLRSSPRARVSSRRALRRVGRRVSTPCWPRPLVCACWWWSSTRWTTTLWRGPRTGRAKCCLLRPPICAAGVRVRACVCAYPRLCACGLCARVCACVSTAGCACPRLGVVPWCAPRQPRGVVSSGAAHCGWVVSSPSSRTPPPLSVAPTFLCVPRACIIPCAPLCPAPGTMSA